MDINKRNRTELKSYFVKNAIPTESNFADLIEGALNQKDDGIVKLPGNPLSIEAAGDATSLKKAINFYRNFNDTNPDWTINLNPRSNPNDANTARLGFNISDGEGNSRLFIDRATGNVGVGTTSPGAKLEVGGDISAGNSDIYFTKTDHTHSSKGNTAGYAALENAKDYDALMILGRAGTAKGRYVRLWDYLQVNGGLDITGNVGIGTATPNVKLHVIGDIRSENGTLWLRAGSDTNHGIGWYGANKLFANTNLDGPVVFGFAGGALGTTSGGQKLTLSWNSSGNVGIGAPSSGEKLQVSGGKIQLDGNQQIKFTDTDTTNNLKLQLWSGYGLGINGGTLFYAANGRHSWRDNNGATERMALTTGADGGLTVMGTGSSFFAGNVGIGTATMSPGARLEVAGGAIIPTAGNSETAGIMFPKNPGGGGGDSAWIRYYSREDEKTTFEIGTSNDGDDHIALMASGNVGIGTTTPGAKLEINATSTTHGGWLEAIRFSRSEHSAITLPTAGLLFGMHSDRNFYFADIKDKFQKYVMAINADTGNVGIGTTPANDKLDVAGNIRILTGSNPLRFTSAWSGFPDGKVTNQAEISNDTGSYKTLMIIGNKSNDGKTRRVSVWDRFEVNGDAVITGNLGTHGYSATPKTSGWGGGIHTWDIEAEGTVWSRNAVQTGARDVAENYFSDETLEPGDVVRLDRTAERIVRSEKPNDTLVVGVISTAPGVLLNVDHDEHHKNLFPVALCGCVPCKVVDENGPIQRGDPLTSSSIPGYAMKALPLKLGGEEFFRSGTIIGKALGSLAEGTGVIEIFVSGQ